VLIVLSLSERSLALAMFRQAVNKRHPKLSVITGIMDTNGRVDLVG
jgi:hypothetical protein